MLCTELVRVLVPPSLALCVIHKDLPSNDRTEYSFWRSAPFFFLNLNVNLFFRVITTWGS